MPAYFSEMGASASTAAFKSSVFPLLGCVGTLFAGWFSDRYLAGRRGPVMAGLMVFLVVALLALGHLDAVAAAFGVARPVMAITLVGVVGFFLLGPYSLVGGVVALDFGGRRTAGTAAGLLDGVGYLAASLSGIGIARILVESGWSLAYTAMAFLTGIAIVLCGLLWRVRPRAAG
jgi:sugar phosphate permease